MNRNYIYGRRSLKNINSCSKDMVRLCYRAMEIANKRKLHCPDFGVTSGYRTLKQQKALYAIGRTVKINLPIVTKCDGVKRPSVHQYNDAIDIVCSGTSKDNGYNPGDLALVVCCFYEAASELELDIDWGGNFRSISDGAHIEIVR